MWMLSEYTLDGEFVRNIGVYYTKARCLWDLEEYEYYDFDHIYDYSYVPVLEY